MLQKADVAEVLAAEGRQHRTRRVMMIALIVAGVAVLATGGWLLWSNVFRSAAASYATAAVTRGDIHVTLVATGTLEPIHEVAVSSITAGTLASIDVDYNQQVSKGQALAHLDMSSLNAHLERAIANVDIQAANRNAVAAGVADAQAALARVEGLTTGKTVTVRDADLAATALTRAKANLAVAEAQLAGAEADLKAAQDDHANGVITAPIDGVVLDINAEAGQSIGTATFGTSLFTIAADLRQLDLSIDVDEADVATVKEGDKVSFTVEAAPDRPLAGVLRQIRSAPSVSSGVVSYKSLISVDNSALLLRPGMTATANIAVDDATGVLTIPNATLRYTPPAAPKSAVPPDDQHVWLLDKDTLRQVAVTTGITDGQRTEIRDGLKEGDVVITGSKTR